VEGIILYNAGSPGLSWPLSSAYILSKHTDEKQFTVAYCTHCHRLLLGNISRVKHRFSVWHPFLRQSSTQLRGMI